MDVALIFCWIFTFHHTGELLANLPAIQTQTCELGRVEFRHGEHAAFRVSRCYEKEMNDE